MRILAIPLALLALAACHKAALPTAEPEAVTTSAAAPATPAPQPPLSPSPPLPADVAGLLDRIEQCDHFAGEEPYDQDRAKFLRERVEATCRGNRELLARLRARYARDRQTLDRLAGLDPPAM